jgi:hypothetical protein
MKMVGVAKMKDPIQTKAKTLLAFLTVQTDLAFKG